MPTASEPTAVVAVVTKRRGGRPPGVLNGTTDARVEEMAQTLRDGSFRPGVTIRAFAAKWGMSEDRAQDISALASKKVRGEYTEPDRVAAKGFAYLERIADEAVVGCDDKGNNAKHLAVAIKAVDTWLVRSGVAAPTKTLVGVADLTQLTDEQLEAKKRELVARMTAKASDDGDGPK